jgi:hypothetical protein
MSASTYTVHHALREDINEVSVWIGDPRHRSRSVIKIVNPRGGLFSRRSVYCAVRQFDKYYDKRREERDLSKIIPRAEHIAMSEWYRAALGIDCAGDTAKAELIFRKTCVLLWPYLRAACCHPDFVARMATRLGVGGLLLGALAVWFGLLAVCPAVENAISNCPTLGNWIWIGWGILFVLSFVACRSRRSA